MLLSDSFAHAHGEVDVLFHQVHVSISELAVVSERPETRLETV